MTDQPTPSSLDTERSILGAILLNPECLKQTDELTVDYFFLDAHRRIFRAMNEMLANGTDVDIVTVINELRSRAELETVGGPGFLSSLTDGVPQRANLTHYARILADKKQRRDLLMVAHRAMTLAYEPTSDVTKALAGLQEQAFKIAADAQPKEVDIFLPAHKFINQAHSDVEWRVERIIEKGTNGIIVAPPKSGKSFLTAYLALCLATGYPFLDLDVKQCRVAMVNREDYAGTTARRLRRLLVGMGFGPDHNLGPYLHVNSRAQCSHLMLDNPRELANLVKNLERQHAEFLVLDVWNTLHGADENSNTEMRGILKHVEFIRDQVGCQIAICHHAKKNFEEGTMISDIARGSNAIGGFAEFLIGLSLVDEEQGIRQIRFETKAAEPYKTFYWKMHDDQQGQSVKLDREQYESKGKRRAAKAV
jgi:RecA-family ATPase